MKILAAMSGGVDSSVAAAMLVNEGHEVTGVHLRLTEQSPAQDGRVHGCCGIADADDARRVAQVLDIPFYVWNFKDAFAHGVIDDFVGEYARGRTPNPCVRCNETVKFGALRARALSLGFDAVATGHYARTRVEDGRWHLYRSADTEKDQSYVLARTGQEELSTARFPVGAQTKDATRELARQLGLRIADKPDSYEICFVPDGDAGGFVERSVEIPAGEIVGTDGAVLGEHPGIHRFTVGQRRGLGINSGSAKTFVLEIDAPQNRIVVGPEEMLGRRGLDAEGVRWIAGRTPERIDAVQVRAHGGVAAAGLLDVDGDRARVGFAEPQRGIAPGQLVAFYLGDEVLGGGTIARANR
ncbi:MAG TPA: tRNA 2-thiouridine(34) synthase MnmA [Actinomycetota bacterium]|nr:tRNA 2-thiouridine(34) synthase MnmA [Actinomycetota bacterium]